MDPPRVDYSSSRQASRSRSLLGTLVAIALLIGAGYLLARYLDRQEQAEVNATELDRIVVALRETRNRLEVYRISGTVTTKSEVRGGLGDILKGDMTAKQPWSTPYFLNMRDLSLDDYIWDSRTRTLLVRAPAVAADAPNIDESRQIVDYGGLIITRDMQTQLRHEVAKGARKQAMDEAAKPEHMAAATRAAREALARNLKAPLQAAGLGDVAIVVRTPVDGRSSDGERWDVSRSIAEVLAERAAR